MCHVSRVTCHVSRVTCHMSHVTKKNIYIYGGASRGRGYYQWGIPRLVYNMLHIMLTGHASLNTQYW